MKTRIEIWVDIDIPQEHVESLRLTLEDAAWDGVRYFRTEHPGVLRELMVQANEVTASFTVRHQISIDQTPDDVVKRWLPKCSCGWTAFMPYFSAETADREAKKHLRRVEG